ncbi:MAG: helix-turn-helix transcriptional regulator [Chloroflexi bacterium]|nr:helix-turn-helix transcriptional regulator [Chloroflexota bacterium]
MALRSRPAPRAPRRSAPTDACCGPLCAPTGELAAAARALRALADPTRLGILAMLAERETLCVCHLVEVFPLGQPTISHHLRLLRQAGFVDCERRGTWCYYVLRPAARAALAWALALPAALAGGEPAGDRGAYADAPVGAVERARAAGSAVAGSAVGARR